MLPSNFGMKILGLGFFSQLVLVLPRLYSLTLIISTPFSMYGPDFYYE